MIETYRLALRWKLSLYWSEKLTTPNWLSSGPMSTLSIREFMKSNCFLKSGRLIDVDESSIMMISCCSALGQSKFKDQKFKLDHWYNKSLRSIFILIKFLNENLMSRWEHSHFTCNHEISKLGRLTFRRGLEILSSYELFGSPRPRWGWHDITTSR